MKKKSKSTIFRLITIILICFFIYLVYNYLSAQGSLNSITSRVKGVTDSLNINTATVIDQANQKLVQKQPIIDNAPEPTPSVQGFSTTMTQEITDQAKEIVENSVEKISEEIQNLPKDQAAKITRQVCDQIISELEK